MRMAGIDKLPIESHVLQAFVSESLKPFLDCVVTFGGGHIYMSQSDKGGLVYGGDLDDYNSYAQRGNLPVVRRGGERDAGAVSRALAKVRLLRSWGGLMRHVDGRLARSSPPVRCPACTSNCGWCYGGFKATPASGWCFAWTIAKDEPHAFNAPFTLERFHRGILIDEQGPGRDAAAALRTKLMLIPCPYCGPRDQRRVHLSGRRQPHASRPGLDRSRQPGTPMSMTGSTRPATTRRSGSIPAAAAPHLSVDAQHRDPRRSPARGFTAIAGTGRSAAARAADAGT